MPTTDPRPPRFLQLFREDAAATREEMIDGLLKRSAQASPKFFYDRLGSQLFDAITSLPEYYPTRTEAGLMASKRTEMAQMIGLADTIIDLGAGNCAKAVPLFSWVRPRRYVAVDISVDFLRDTLQRLQFEHPGIAMTGLGLDFSSALALPEGVVEGRPLFFYPGSSIGNFEPEAAGRLLRQVRAQVGDGGLLIGVDLVKPIPLLEAAYDDALGVTAAFNLNLLRHANRVIGSDFEPRDWQHRAFYEPGLARIEMHLEARRDLTVRWPGGQRGFAAGERLHTEHSHKYTTGRFAAMLRDAGFGRSTAWVDERGWFAVFWAQA